MHRRVDKDQRLPQWRRAVTNEAIEKQAEYLQTKPNLVFPLRGPIGMTVTFVMERPKFHYGTGKNERKLKESAPPYPVARPDLDKLVRSVFDSITDAKLWVDDSQVVWVQTKKVYDVGRPGVAIELGEMR